MAVADDYGFLSERWHGIKTLTELNGSRHKYRGTIVDVVDIRTKKRVGRMDFGAMIRKFN